MVTASAWSHFWEALVALGTLSLAAVTYLLVRKTGAEIRAQWRPAIIPATDPTSNRAISFPKDHGRLRVRVRNAGRGPALYVRAHLDPGGVSPENWSLGALAPDDEIELTFAATPKEDAVQILLDYRDLSDRAHSSAIVITDLQGDAHFYDVHLWENHSVTPLGDAVYPQPGLKDGRPPPRRSLGLRIHAAIHAFRETPAQR